MDIISTPKSELILRDSNISTITMSFGGVGRNIAENLARIGFSVKLMTAFGDDEYANMHRAHLRKLNIDLSYTMSCMNESSCVYVCVNDVKGDMYVAMNDMNICDIIQPEIIPLNAINSCDACIFDTNLSDAAIEYICDRVNIPIFVDTVSTAKAHKLQNVLSKIHTLKPNIIEAESLTGESDPYAAARALVDMGVKRVFVSLGDSGVIYADKNGASIYRQTLVKDNIVNTTGAGDSTTAALCAAFLLGADVEETLALSSRMNALTIRSSHAVSEELSEELLEPILKRKK